MFSAFCFPLSDVGSRCWNVCPCQYCSRCRSCGSLKHAQYSGVSVEVGNPSFLYEEMLDDDESASSPDFSWNNSHKVNQSGRGLLGLRGKDFGSFASLSRCLLVSIRLLVFSVGLLNRLVLLVAYGPITYDILIEGTCDIKYWSLLFGFLFCLLPLLLSLMFLLLFLLTVFPPIFCVVQVNLVC